MSIQHEANIL
jgi:hypothetical protein